ncbi:MAG: HD-GYP domain-containing protein [Elusimicrobia bacterium]|nr:HD-GYP domain-containing protein [Elusimicrobiota bacterium]
MEDRGAALIQKHRSLRKLYLNTVEAIVRAIEAKDPYTVGHSKRVSKYSALLAHKMNMPADEIADIEVAGLLHDVGKIGISDELLRKPSKLTVEEYETIQEHPLISLKILDPIHELKRVKEYVKYHHEKWDGKGYPDGLKEEDIPTGAMILAVADAFDTMWIGRLYHPPWDLETVVKEFQKNSGSQFDPKVVDAFVLLIKENRESLEKVRKENPPRFS